MTSRIVFLSLAVSLFLQVHGFQSEIAWAQERPLPFLAESTGDQVNVRAGQSANFEKLCQLSKGEEVVVFSKEYSWYKIQLPPSAKSFVSKDYVQFLGQNAGGVTATDVNIRAGAGIHHTILGQLAKGEQIYIQEEFDEWYRIEPLSESYGWVSQELLTFKSKDISSYQMLPPRSFVDEPISEPILLADEQNPSEEIMNAVDNVAEDFIKAESKGIITVVGFVEPYEDEGTDGIYFKIVAGGQPVCYIQGTNHMLGRFVHQKVSVDGTVNQKLLSKYSQPVVVVLKIRLIL